MGQGTLTGLAQLVAEELECNWDYVKTEYPTPGENLALCVELAKQAGLCQVGERVVGVHDVDLSPVMKIMTVE